MTQQLNESLQYLDMENQVIPELGVDKYKSSIGDDDEFITLNFTVRSKACAEDLVNWLERGYDWIIDADTSPGEVTTGKFLVFVEMNRRTSVPARVIEMLDDLETLTDIKAEDWKLNIGEGVYPASVETIKKMVDLSPQEYRDNESADELEVGGASDEDELNEMRIIAGLEPHATVNATQVDPAIQALKLIAGIE